ncbi:NAD(P)H-hydrate epimerase [Aeromicrobium sp. 50.2.37]|uniref:NAD(P)H-hydrate epimerase n=1 Tax=Aeromicrobium sp. 50.2.37 TaxID=2969305 RepID=UPI00214FEFF3|nr:NAD(P)H-hydrate epimerase [Aeromicrobium sp. 50.2.37]MCR4514959.1 NAD(P)H-hydrate epimerase [Aeromicrobium sp. 50.2.37]
MLSGHTVAQVRDAEERLARETGWDALMQRAARGLADALDDVPAGDVVVVLVGPGNNGGDALFAATHLLDRGVRVDLALLDPDAVHAEGLEAARAAGAQRVDGPGAQRWCLDALFGIGARAGLEGRAADWARWTQETSAHVVAVDVPSGVDVDTGAAPGVHVRADRTVTFGTYKVCSLVGPAADAGGGEPPHLVDIGLGPHLPSAAVEALVTGDGELLRRHAPGGDSHKYARGVVGVSAGSDAYAGAAHLCVAGAQSGLAGMLRFVGSDALAARVVDRAPEVVHGRGRVQAWVVGPGAGDDVDAQLAACLEDGVPVVVDAGALEHLPEPAGVAALLTPHAGELARMLDVERDVVEADPLRHAQAASQRWGATVLLKGARTVVVRPDGTTAVNLSGAPWLGTAGSGDVLAGFAGSLLAGGLDPFDAGRLAAFLHGAAAVRANPGGPVTASQVAAALPATVAAFLDGSLGEVRRW